MNTYKHSGATGDLIYSLAIARHFGPGNFYLHLNQMNWVGQHYYGALPAPFHKDRLNQKDFEWMQSFMLSQPYIKDFDLLNNNHAITHNLDKFRPLFVGHPGNYVDIYATAFGIVDPTVRTQLRNTPWLSVPKTNQIKPRVINRTHRWLPPELPDQWHRWREQGWEESSIFVGLPDEYEKFKKDTGWNIPYHPCRSMLELAQTIAAADTFVGNQSQALALAIGLGTKFYCELRRDLPQNRNECYFHDHPNSNYF